MKKHFLIFALVLCLALAALPACQCYRLGNEWTVALANDSIKNAVKSENPAAAFPPSGGRRHSPADPSAESWSNKAPQSPHFDVREFFYAASFQ